MEGFPLLPARSSERSRFVSVKPKDVTQLWIFNFVFQSRGFDTWFKFVSLRYEIITIAKIRNAGESTIIEQFFFHGNLPRSV